MTLPPFQAAGIARGVAQGSCGRPRARPRLIPTAQRWPIGQPTGPLVSRSGSSLTSSHGCGAGLATSNTPGRGGSGGSTVSSGTGSAPVCASGTSVPVCAGARPILSDGPMPASRITGGSPYRRLMKPRHAPVRKPATGEPCAGEPPARLGRRRGQPSRPRSTKRRCHDDVRRLLAPCGPPGTAEPIAATVRGVPRRGNRPARPLRLVYIAHTVSPC